MLNPRNSDVIFSYREEEETIGNVLYREMLDKYQDFFNSLFFEQPRQKLLCECIVDGMLNCSDLSPKFLKRRTNNTCVELTNSEAAEMTCQLLLIRQKEKEDEDLDSSDNSSKLQVTAQPPTILSPTNHYNTNLVPGKDIAPVTGFHGKGEDCNPTSSMNPLPVVGGKCINDKISLESSSSSSLTTFLMEVWKKNEEENYQNGTSSTCGDESLQRTENDEDLTPLPLSEEDMFPVTNDAATKNSDDPMDTDDDVFTESDDFTPLPLNCEVSFGVIQDAVHMAGTIDSEREKEDEAALASFLRKRR